jgi:hypothetical protein
VSPGSLLPIVTLSEQIKREKVGPLETEYVGDTPHTQADAIMMAVPVVTTIEALLYPFLGVVPFFVAVV